MTVATAPAHAVRVPDLAEVTEVAVIELHVQVGDLVAADAPLVTLESEKAAMDVPAPASGRVVAVCVAVGDHVITDAVLIELELSQPSNDSPPLDAAPVTGEGVREAIREHAAESTPDAVVVPPTALPHAGPSVRRLARELDIDLTTVVGSGERGRILTEDLLALLRQGASLPTRTVGSPRPDPGAFGPTTRRELTRVQRLSGPHLQQAWTEIPHVTHHDEADITDLDTYRAELDATSRADGVRVTLLAFVMKACSVALQAFPEVNSSLESSRDALLLKHYYHIGVAVDTPEGLVVPVVRDVDRKGVLRLSSDLGDVSGRARAGQLLPADLQGGTFTVSSLGGIGGTGFTPVVNAPQAAILGVARAALRPVWTGDAFSPRLILPLSLSYDHRIIDGAGAARFTRHLCHLLEDVRRLVL